MLEAWVDRVPVMVNGRCDPTRDHCARSGGGLWFTSFREFEAVLARLANDAALRSESGGRGRAYVDRHYQWPVLIARYATFLDSVVARGRLLTLPGVPDQKLDIIARCPHPLPRGDQGRPRSAWTPPPPRTPPPARPPPPVSTKRCRRRSGGCSRQGSRPGTSMRSC